MSIIKTSKIEIEIQEQKYPDADVKWMVLLKYENKTGGCEVQAVGLTDYRPIINKTIDLGDKIVNGNSH